jgi:NADH-quinone oxidoreductase subunit C
MTEVIEIETIRKRFADKVHEIVVKNDRRATIAVSADAIVTVSEFLVRELCFRFIIATAVDTDRGIEILYHFSKDEKGLVLNVNVLLDKADPAIESLTGLLEGANWIEREMHEIMGINFINHPNLEKLVSDGNWAEGVYPYRKNEK